MLNIYKLDTGKNELRFDMYRKEYPEMKAHGTSQLGYFIVFGFTKNPQFLERKLRDRLGIVPRTIDFGPAGRFFLYASYGDMAETEEAIALKLGFVRTPAMSPLSAQQLLEQKVVSPEHIDPHALRGNALVACFSKTRARFSVYKTLLSGFPFYYSVSDDGLFCSDRLRCLAEIVKPLELDEAAIPQHFLLLGTVGSRTYFRNVQFLRAGECLRWEEGGIKVHLVKDFRSLKNDPTFGNLDARSPLIYQWLKDLVGAYISDMQKSGFDFGNLLSGGVDSSLTQLLINEHLSGAQARSFSYLMHAPSFEPEVEYVKHAQLALNTEHVFVDILPKDYPDLLVRSIEVLGQPVYMALDPAKLALAESLADDSDNPHYFFHSQGADAVFGSSVAQKVRKLELASRIPASALILNSVGKLLKPMKRQSKMLLKASAVIKDPNHLLAPINTVVANADYDLPLRCFGEKAVQRVVELRREQELEYMNSHSYQESVHLVVCLHPLVYLASQETALFISRGKELVYPFMDEDVIRASFAVKPEKRYIKGRRVKPILKDILEQRSPSPAARLPKLGSSFDPDVFAWMDSGPLRELVRDIERPGFLSRSDFESLLEQPKYYFLWALLTFDVFSKRFLRR
jgi:asparagine synthetase B (glutamine-hydrolysing)